MILPGRERTKRVPCIADLRRQSRMQFERLGQKVFKRSKAIETERLAFGCRPGLTHPLADPCAKTVPEFF
jgi:hypothetical protein